MEGRAKVMYKDIMTRAIVDAKKYPTWPPAEFPKVLWQSEVMSDTTNFANFCQLMLIQLPELKRLASIPKDAESVLQAVIRLQADKKTEESAASSDATLTAKRAERGCLYPGCKQPACYNTRGENKCLYCVAHKKPGMVSMVSSKTQQQEVARRTVESGAQRSNDSERKEKNAINTELNTSHGRHDEKANPKEAEKVINDARAKLLRLQVW